VGCPLCKEDEDNEILLKCKGRREEVLKILDEFHLFLTSIDTCLEVQYGMTQEINKWIHDESHYDVYSNDIEIAMYGELRTILRIMEPRRAAPRHAASSIVHRPSSIVHRPSSMLLILSSINRLCGIMNGSGVPFHETIVNTTNFNEVC
jgi:hypothetical protein